MRRILSFAFSLLLCVVVSHAQEEDRDSLVRLLSADKARLVELNGKAYRKVVGDAVFFHNNTYLKCDSAYWNVDDEYIDAIGSIRIEQENTVLTGDSIRYVIAENTAKFRGHLVELVDRDSNVLRTNYLDYNTKDSVAFFYRGGAMKDEDGNVIESLTGRYQSRIEQFDFIGQVEMFSDCFLSAIHFIIMPTGIWLSSSAIRRGGMISIIYPPGPVGTTGLRKNSSLRGMCTALPRSTSFGAILSIMTGMPSMPDCWVMYSCWIQWTMP